MELSIKERQSVPFPLRLPEDINERVRSAFPPAMVYDRFKKKAFCTSCERQFDYQEAGGRANREARTVHTIHELRADRKVRCPVCGCVETAVPHTRRGCVSRFFVNLWTEGEELLYSIDYAEWWVEGKEAPLLSAYQIDYYHGNGVGRIGKGNWKILSWSYWCGNYADVGRVPHDIKDYPLTYLTDIGAVFDRSAFKHSDWRKWEKRGFNTLVEYLKLCSKYPQIEYIEKAGLESLVESAVYKAPTYIRPNWKADRLDKFLGISMAEFKKLKKRTPPRVLPETIGAFKLLRKDGVPTEEDVAFMRDTILGKPDIWAVIKDMDRIRTVRYLRKVITSAKAGMRCHGYYPGDGYVLTLYSDYLKQLKELGYPQDAYYLYPNELRAAHDRISEEYNRREDELRRQKEQEREKKYQEEILPELERLVWKRDGLIIRPLRTFQEFIQEGRDNHNCVASYWERAADNKCWIFVIRTEDAPERSFVTVEVRNLMIVQIRGFGNKEVSAEVRGFAEAWTREMEKKRKIAA